eukprot:scaffold80716_cov66-Phaeocystis_antarctica.AAC.2
MHRHETAGGAAAGQTAWAAARSRARARVEPVRASRLGRGAAQHGGRTEPDVGGGGGDARVLIEAGYRYR